MSDPTPVEASLFEIQGGPRLVAGEPVVAQMMHGDVEATFVEHVRVDGFPCARVRVRGVLVTLDIARVRPLP